MSGTVCVYSIHFVRTKNSTATNFWDGIHNDTFFNAHIVMLNRHGY